MTATRSPYRDPEFLKSVHVVPYDTEAAIQTQRDDEAAAVRMFHLRLMQERQTRRVKEAVGEFAKGIGLAVSVLGALWLFGCL